MSIITVKVEDALKNQAAAVLDELGLDVPTAIRMYLKSIVRENGLPIDTKLASKPVAASTPAALDEGKATLVEKVTVEEPAAPIGKAVTVEELFEEELPAVAAAPAAEEPAAEEESTPVVEEAAAPAMVIDYETRAGRKAIAALFIDTICAVPEGKLTRWKDMEAHLSAQYGTEVTRPQSIRWPATKDDGTEIPYWRIVGDRGAVRGDKMIEQSVQEEKLKAEGHAFITAGHGIFTGIKVDSWKEKLV